MLSWDETAKNQNLGAADLHTARRDDLETFRFRNVVNSLPSTFLNFEHFNCLNKVKWLKEMKFAFLWQNLGILFDHLSSKQEQELVIEVAYRMLLSRKAERR